MYFLIEWRYIHLNNHAKYLNIGYEPQPSDAARAAPQPSHFFCRATPMRQPRATGYRATPRNRCFLEHDEHDEHGAVFNTTVIDVGYVWKISG